MHFEKRTPVFLQLGLPAGALPALREYSDLLWAANEELNLLSRKMTYEEFIDNHLIDCLLPLRRMPSTVSVVADFGSGGGLPGVLFALSFPQMRFQLFEKSPKKQHFLNRCRSIAPNLEVRGQIPRDLEHVDLVIARAFKPIDMLLEVSREYFLRGGRYFLLKGRREKIDEELALAQKRFKGLRASIEPLASPVLQVERHLVLLNGD